MPVLTFLLERLETPTGRILIVTDDQGCLRAIDWEDHEPRMQALLKRHYGACRFRLREMRQPSMTRRSLHAYFEGNLEALTDQPTGWALGFNAIPRAGTADELLQRRFNVRRQP